MLPTTPKKAELPPLVVYPLKSCGVCKNTCILCECTYLLIGKFWTFRLSSTASRQQTTNDSWLRKMAVAQFAGACLAV